jgi:YD repeat-containing protein
VVFLGLAEVSSYHFAGLPSSESRTLAVAITTDPTWNAIAALTDPAAIAAAAAPALQAETFTTTTAYDALGRVTSRSLPDATVLLPSYNDGGQLESVSARIRGASTPTVLTSEIRYNARGQRTQVAHGNGVTTAYGYEPETFRLLTQVTTRQSDAAVLQNLRYEHDPVGNLVEATDLVSYGNSAVSATGRYTYDALYRLTSAEGREHPAQQPTNADPALLELTGPDDLQGLERYTESYAYDASGNLLSVAHVPTGSGSPWTRSYTYQSIHDRLPSVSLPGGGTYTPPHDAAGNITALSHLPSIVWNPLGQLQCTNHGEGGNTYYAYDAGGQRVRKAYVHSGITEVRVYSASSRSTAASWAARSSASGRRCTSATAPTAWCSWRPRPSTPPCRGSCRRPASASSSPTTRRAAASNSPRPARSSATRSTTPTAPAPSERRAPPT